jgi:hypothetical protein
MRIEENLAKSFPPHARGVRNQTGLLMVAAGRPSDWPKIHAADPQATPE